MANQSSAVTVHYDDLVAQHPPPVLVIKKQPRSAGPEAPEGGKNTKVWKYPLAVLSIAETFVQSARDLEAHMEDIFETCKSSSEEETRKAMVQTIKEELGMRWNEAADKAKEIVGVEMEDMTTEQKEQLKEFVLHMTDFCEKLVEWVNLIVNKAMDEVIKGHKVESGTASRIVGAIVKAYDQLFMHDLLEMMS